MVKRLAIYGISVMMDSIWGIIFAILGAAYVLARTGGPVDITSGDVFWLMGATVVVSAALNLPGEVRRWAKPE